MDVAFVESSLGAKLGVTETGFSACGLCDAELELAHAWFTLDVYDGGTAVAMQE